MKDKNIIILLVSLLVLFVISTMVLTYSFLYVKTDFLSEKSDETTTEDLLEEKDNSENEVVSEPTELDDAVLYSASQYGIYVNLPNYTLEHELGGTEVTSMWTIQNYVDEKVDLLDNYQTTLRLKFFPEWIPDNVAGGRGILCENQILINIFEKGEYKSLEEVKDAVVAKYSDIADEVIQDPVTGDMKEKWGLETYSYRRQQLMGDTLGYLVLGDDYVYDISYYINDRYSESEAVAQEIIDTISFTF
jgi:hypothetical protein